MPFVGFVVNRVHEPQELRAPARPEAAAAGLAAKLVELARDEARLRRVERRAIAGLERASRRLALRIPEQDNDVHDLRGVVAVARQLLGR
jgi:hypothetical protein